MVAGRDQGTQLARHLFDGESLTVADRKRACPDGVHVGFQGSAAAWRREKQSPSGAATSRENASRSHARASVKVIGTGAESRGGFSRCGLPSGAPDRGTTIVKDFS